MTNNVPARQGAHAFLEEGSSVKIKTQFGHQVVDLREFPAAGELLWMSIAQTRSKLQRLIPTLGDTFMDIRRQAVLTLVEDTSPGIHDIPGLR